MKTIFKWLFGLAAVLIIAVIAACINAQTGVGVLMSTFAIAGFTEEQSKSFNEFMTKQSAEVQEKVKGLIDSIKDSELIKGIQKLLNGEDGKSGIVGNVPLMQKQLDEIATQLKKIEIGGIKNDELLDLDGAVKQLLDSPEFKAAKADKFSKSPAFNLKADTSVITGTIARTMMKPGVGFAPLRDLAFLNAGLSVGYIGQDKSYIGWMEGAYTSNVGYVAEGTGSATADTGTSVEKTRAMAKISAKLPLTAELLEDAEYIASAFRIKLQENSLLFADSELYSGNGADGGAYAKHIYGIQGQSTAYNQTTTGVTDLIENANIGDLVDDVIVQAQLSQQRGLNTLWMNPKDFRRFKAAKDKNGQYLFVKDVNGTYTVQGMNVISTTAITSNTMLAANAAKIQLWWKRQPEIKFSQMNGTDFIDDAYTAVLFLRCQCVVEAQDQTALIYVSDIDAAIEGMTKPIA